MDQSYIDIFRSVTSLGGTAMMALGIVAMFKGWVVWGREKDEAERQARDWKERADRNEQIAWKAANVLEQLLPLVERTADELREMPPKRR